MIFDDLQSSYYEDFFQVTMKFPVLLAGPGEANTWFDAFFIVKDGNELFRMVVEEESDLSKPATDKEIVPKFGSTANPPAANPGCSTIHSACLPRYECPAGSDS